MLTAAPSPSLDVAAADTIRRLTFVLNDIDPVDTTVLQRLRDLCQQLHLSQNAIDTASACKAEAAPVPGFRHAVLAFTRRLHAALQGKPAALVLQSHADVEQICLGLCAFASIRAPSPYPARPDLMDEARQALDGITGHLLAIVDAQHGVDSMVYGQMLNVHNWISRACKARLLTADSASMKAVKTFSTEVFGEFSRRASVWRADAVQSMHLDEHNIGKTAAELKTMLDYGLVPFIGQEDGLAQVVAWLSSAQSFALLLAAENGVGLSSLFSLYKSILDIGVRGAEALADPGSAQGALPGEQDPLAPLWTQMIASIGLLDPQQLLSDDGRFLAACANLLRAMHETGLPRGWSADQRLAFTNAGRRVLDMVAGADPARLASIALPTLANLVSFIKAWHKHELKGTDQPAASEHPAAKAPHQRTALHSEMLKRLRHAAEQVVKALSPDRLAQLDRNETIGALFKGLFSLRQARLLALALVDPLLVTLASAVANMPNWPTNHAIDIAKGLNALFSDRVFEWEALQPAFHALMGRPAQGESWSESDVAAFLRGMKVESRQMLSVPLERHVKPVSATQHKPLRNHVVGDHPLLAPPVRTPISETAAAPLTSPNPRPSGMPRYAKRDADGFIEPSRVSKATSASPEAAASRLALATGREVDDDDEQPLVKAAPGKVVKTAASAATMAQRASKRTPASPALPGSSKGNSKGSNERSNRKAKTVAAAASDFADESPLRPLRGSNAFGLWLPPPNTSSQQHAIAGELFAAIDKGDENKALALLAESDAEQLAGYYAESLDSLLSFAIVSKMPALALAILGTPAGRKHASQSNISGVTPLHLAAGLGNMALLNALLRIEEVVRCVNQKGNDGYDAVGAALVIGHAAVLERLMQVDAVWEQLPQTVYSGGHSIVKEAFARGRIDALKVLVTHPELARQAATEVIVEIAAKRDVRTEVTLAQHAAHNGDMAMLAILTAVAEVRAHEAAIASPLNLAGVALHSTYKEVFDHVLGIPELQPLVGLRTVSGCTPLMLAVWANDAGLFAKLVALAAVRATVLSGPGARSPINMRWPQALPPESFQYSDVLELAIQRGKREMAAVLLQVQEVLDAVDTRGDYAQKVLLLLIRHGMPEALKGLLQRPIIGKIILFADKGGMTPLHHAAQAGQDQAVKLLMQKLPATEITRPNRDGKTAIDLAREAGQDDIADFLASVARVRRTMGIQ